MAEIPSRADTSNMHPSSPPPADLSSTIELTIHHHGKPSTFTFSSDATITDLSSAVSNTLSIPPSNQKYMITPKLGVLKPPFTNLSLPLSSLLTKKITLLGTTPTEITSLNTPIPTSTRRTNSPIKSATPARTRDFNKAHDNATYTFHTLRPLPHLPNPSRSLDFLSRLRSDAGILATMRTHQFSVPLLTEMDPAAHTTHDSRTLGLNRNKGEVIELRLRTDAYDGYRDYKTIRKTLCHELAHCVYGEHDRDFWRLCGEIEKEVERGDWRSGGRTVSEEVFYEPGEEHVDHGGWTGGEFVLGAGGVESSAGGGGRGSASDAMLSRREILAQAAEERMKKQKRVDRGGYGASGPSSSS